MAGGATLSNVSNSRDSTEGFRGQRLCDREQPPPPGDKLFRLFHLAGLAAPRYREMDSPTKPIFVYFYYLCIDTTLHNEVIDSRRQTNQDTKARRPIWDTVGVG